MIYNLLSNDWVKFPKQALRSRFNLIFVILKEFECDRQDSLGEVDNLLIVDVLVIVKYVYQLVY